MRPSDRWKMAVYREEIAGGRAIEHCGEATIRYWE
jgi:hypothetical protein